MNFSGATTPGIRSAVVTFEAAADIGRDFLDRYKAEPRRIIVTMSTVEGAKRFKRGSVIDLTYQEWSMSARVYARRGVRVFLREVQGWGGSR